MSETQDIRKVELLADFSNADNTYNTEQFGNHVIAPLMVRNQYGKLTSKNSGFKLWMQKEQYKNILPGKLPFIPHEYIQTILQEYNQKFADVMDQEFETLGTKWHIQKPEYSHQEMTCYWKILSDKFYTVKGSAEKGDDVQLGVVIRNGIDTHIALGADVYTNRVICQNGAIARGADLGTFSIKHIGSTDKIIESFQQGLRVVFNRMKDLMQYYEESTRVKINQKMIERLYDSSRIADKYWPDYVNIDKEVQKTSERVKLLAQGKDHSLYETFNHLTDALSRSYENHTTREHATRAATGIGFTSLYRHTNALHHEMINIVSARRLAA